MIFLRWLVFYCVVWLKWLAWFIPWLFEWRDSDGRKVKCPRVERFKNKRGNHGTL